VIIIRKAVEDPQLLTSPVEVDYEYSRTDEGGIVCSVILDRTRTSLGWPVERTFSEIRSRLSEGETIIHDDGEE